MTNMLAIFLKPLILRARSARKIKGFRKMAKVLMTGKFLRRNRLILDLPMFQPF